MSSTTLVHNTREGRTGFAHWMERVIKEYDRVKVDFDADPVHDLRVALRRSRSLADGLIAIDPDPSWKLMKKAGKQLFTSLGGLRDTQVMQGWVCKLGREDDPVALHLLSTLKIREVEHKRQAAQAIEDFDLKLWQKWSETLPLRAAKFRAGSLLFRHLALERWTAAHQLHAQALRNRSRVSLHALRIGIKRFRYIVENFLPAQHALWKDDLKELQDCLGEIHDFDVLWMTAVSIHAFPDQDSKTRWHQLLSQERASRIESYRRKMLGKSSLWQVWRHELPQGDQVTLAALGRMKTWAAILDPDFKHANHVSALALQLYDGLPPRSAEVPEASQRIILRLAALLHDVGRAKREKGHHKQSQKMISGLTPPLGIGALELHLAGVVARYHRGALPRLGQKSLVGLTPGQRQDAQRLAGILRLAEAFDVRHDLRIQSLKISQQDGCFVVGAQGYSARDPMAEEVASARYLLETVYHRPLYIKPLPIKAARQLAGNVA